MSESGWRALRSFPVEGTQPSSDVARTPQEADAEALYEGDGSAAQHAWQAFRNVATGPAYDPIEAWEETVAVRNAGFLFEGGFSKGGPIARTARGRVHA